MMAKAQAALFLDRDGTVIQEKHFLSKVEEVEYIPGVPESLLRLKQAGYLLFILTNQTGVARGFFDEAQVQRVNQRCSQLLEPWGVDYDGIFYCPHHPTLGQAPYRQVCDCRKPGTGMVKQAQERFNIDLPRSFMLGDRLCDVELGLRAGMGSIHLLTGHGAEDRAQVQDRFPQALCFDALPLAEAHLLAALA